MQRFCAGDFSKIDWLAISDGEARSLLERRLHQLAVELSPGWNGYRALRSMVARLIDEGLPDAPEALPLTLHDQDRLSPGPVALAVAWVLQHVPGVVRAPSAVARILAREYLPRFVPLSPANDDREIGEPIDLDASPERLVDALDADRLQRALFDLDPDGLELLRRRTRGDSLDSIARAHGAGLTTIHTRERHARQRFASFVRKRGFSAAAVLACLHRSFAAV